MFAVNRLFTSFVVGALISLAGQLNSQTESPGVGIMPSTQTSMQMSQFAPFLLEDNVTHNELTLVVNNPEPCHVNIVLSDLLGNTIATFQETVQAHGKVSLQLADKLRQLHIPLPLQGSIAVVPQELATVGAQLSITREEQNTGNSSTLEEEFFMPQETAKGDFYALGLELAGDPVIALRSSSSKLQNVLLTCVSERRPPINSSIPLAANATIHVRACSNDMHKDLTSSALDLFDSLNARKSKKTFGVAVASDAMPGELAIYGFSPGRTGYESLNFQQIDTTIPKSSVFVGVPKGSLSEMQGESFTLQAAIANFSNSTQSAKVLAPDPSGTGQLQFITKVSVLPHATVLVNLPNLPNEVGLANSVIIAADDAGPVLSNIRAISSSNPKVSIEIPIKDLNKTTNGGQHPWQIGNGVNSQLILFNADETKSQPADIQIYKTTEPYWDGSSWQLHLMLAPLQTYVLDIQKLAADETKDANEYSFSKDAKQGIVNWFSLPTNKVFGRMMITNDHLLYARNFSCQNQTIACGAAIESLNTGRTTYIGSNIGQTQTIKGDALTCVSSGTCTCNGTGACTTQGNANSYTWNTSNSAIASVTNTGGSTAYLTSLTGKALGKTTLTLGVSLVCSPSASATVQVQACPTSLSVDYGIQISVAQNSPPYLTGIGSLFNILSGGPANYDGALVVEWLSTQSNNCPNVQSSNGQGATFTVGYDGTAGRIYNTNYPGIDNSFWDQHAIAWTNDVLAGQPNGAQCQLITSQQYKCNGNTIGNYLITYTLTHGTYNGQAVTYVLAQKTAQ